MSEVCQCEETDHTVGICIGQCREALYNAAKWFIMLREHCEHHKGVLCQIPVSKEVPAGLLRCGLHTCPLIGQVNQGE